MTNIIDYTFTTFPTKDHILLQFKNYCFQFEDLDNWNWRDFTQKLADFLFSQDNQISISNSSTWAVCQEFLGNLSGKELQCAQSRGGLWALRNNKNDEQHLNSENTDNKVEVISVRRVLNELRNKYTEEC